MNALAKATPKKWTKKAIKELQSQIDGFALVNRMYYRPEVIRAHIEANRRDVVLGGLRGFRSLYAERAQKNAETARHFEANPKIYGDSTPEMVARFDGFAADERKSVANADALIARVEAEGLPPEVAAYLPPAMVLS